MSERPTWHHLSECPRCVWYRPNLLRTGTTALIVGTVLFVINHLLAVLRAQTDAATWLATGVSFVVPFCVANLGMLIATRRPEPGAAPAADGDESGAPTWTRLSECPRCVVHRPHLVRTATTALVIGTIYFAINQLGVVAAGHATASVWAAAGLTYLVPFSVSNVGLLVGCRREPITPP